MKLLKVIRWSFVALSFLILMSALAWGASVPVCEKTGSFVVSIISKGEPVKEIDGVAVIPFGSEYKLSLKNNNGRRAVAKITIDGTNISSFGNLVVPANGKVKLERFITQSLSEGKKFKFVSLDHPKVDDPDRKENGLIRVEFRIEKKEEYISPFYGNILIPDQGFYKPYSLDNNLSSTHILTSGTLASNNAEPGATIGGSKSEQKFHKVELEFEDKIWVVEIQLKGIKP